MRVSAQILPNRSAGRHPDLQAIYDNRHDSARSTALRMIRASAWACAVMNAIG
jgi:hypothetical protein